MEEIGVYSLPFKKIEGSLEFMKERKARGISKVLRLVSLQPHSHNPHNSHNSGLPHLPSYSEEIDIEKLNTIHQDLFGLMVEVQRVLLAYNLEPVYFISNYLETSNDPIKQIDLILDAVYEIKQAIQKSNKQE